MKQDINSIEKVNLDDYMVAEGFRTVEREQFKLSHGVREIPVILTLDESLIEKLDFPIPKRKQIFGFATARNYSLEKFDNIKRIQFEPSESPDFLMIVIIAKGGDEYYRVEQSQLVDLLEGALRIPAQRKR